MESIIKNICENCGKEHDGSYGSGRFCSERCARSFSSKNDKNQKTKQAKCVECGKNIVINKRSSEKTCKCEECKEKYHRPSHIKTCSLCGRIHYKYEGGCKNDFCRNHTLQEIEGLVKVGFDSSKIGTEEVEKEYLRVREVLYDLYWNKNMSNSDIAKYFNYTGKHSIIQNTFKYLNIPIRSIKEATKLSFITGKNGNNISNNQYKSCWHKTWNNKEVYLRSSYELDYANELDNNQIDYEVESLRIKYFDSQLNEYRCAIPDFYIPNENLIVEIKSKWTLDIINMQDKFKAYKELGYNCKIICNHKEIEI